MEDTLQGSRYLAIASLFVCTSGWIFGQTSSSSAFEVASIKSSSGDPHQVAVQMLPGGGLRANGASLQMLLTMAYDVREFQISRVPSWITSERYDIMARPERGNNAGDTPGEMSKTSPEERRTAQEQMRQRLQALLADRFQLKIHRETKEQPIYAMVVAKSGPKIQPSEAKEGPRGMMRAGRGQLMGQAVELRMLAGALASQVGRPVLDQTNLQGLFDFKLEWTPDPGQPAGALGVALPPGVELPPPEDPNGPSIFSALQDQLGLRLDSQKGPVEMIVIDRVEKPSEN